MSWKLSRWGRIDQGRRELAVALGKDVSVEKLAELIGLAGPSLWGWKQGSRPKETSIEALEAIFLGAGLTLYTRRYIDYGPELEEAPKVGKSGSRAITHRDLAEPSTKRQA